MNEPSENQFDDSTPLEARPVDTPLEAESISPAEDDRASAMDSPYQSPPDNSLDGAPKVLTSLACLQLVLGLAIQVGIYFAVDLYWAICATPMLFAAFASVHLNELDAESERRVKRILTLVTLISIGVAMLFRRFLSK